MTVTLPGHLGNNTYIKLTPGDFVNYAGGANVYWYFDIDVDGGAVDAASAVNQACFVLVPQGYKATHVQIYAEATDADGVDVFTCDIDDGDTTQILTNGSTNVEEAITNDTADDTNYLTIIVSPNSLDIYGGYVKIAAA